MPSPKPFRNEQHNNEALKAIIRCSIEELIAAQEEVRRSYMEAAALTNTIFLEGQIKETDLRITTLKWVLWMYRPADKNTINQWNKQDATETSQDVP